MTDELTRIVSHAALTRSATVLVCLVAAATLGLWAWSLRRMPLPRRVTLLALRTVGMATALVVVLQPALRRERRAHMPSRVVVLVDESASMSLPDQGRSRLETALDVAKHALEDQSLRAPDRSVELYALPQHADRDGKLTPVALPPQALAAQTATGTDTRLVESLERLPRSPDRDLAGVIVVSDGADHGVLGSGADVHDRLAALDAPIHTITVGDPAVRDLTIDHVAHDDFAFVRTPISFEVEVRAIGGGWQGRSVPVVLRRDGQVVATTQVVLADGLPQKVSLRHVPERIGEFVFDVSIPPQPGELTPRNNLSRFPLRVVRDRVRVLQVCGRPSWDERFLRSLLKRDPNIDLVSFFILRTPNSVEVASTDELSLIQFPTDELFRQSLHTFDLVVLQNFDFGPYQMGIYLPEIRRYVEEGGALAMLGGELSFDGGGWANTAVESVLPVELGVPAPAIDTHAVHARLTTAGKTHPLTALALDVDESARLFAELPALDGVNLVRRARSDATVLAVHPTLLDADHQPLPIIAVREAGKGRVLTVGSDSTWRWAFEGPATGTRRPYERFWESAIRWLVRDPALSLLRLELDKDSNQAHVTAVGPDYQPISGAKVEFSLERIADPEAFGSAPVDLAHLAPEAGATDERGHVDRALPPLPEGAYRFVATSTLGGRPARDEKILVVAGTERELADPVPRPALMKTLAVGGEARTASQGTSGLALRPPREVRVAASEDRPLWTSPLTLFVGFGALALAWWLGRRWGRR
ncbi:MAG: glutamine amidotransferase [Polyangia bacterium]